MGGIGSGGHNRKSTEDLLTGGGFRSTRHADRLDANQSPPGKPRKPRGLGQYGKQVWDDVVKSLPDSVLGTIDSTVLAEMCRWYQDYRTAESFSVRCKCWDKFHRIALDYGMTPSARAAMRVPLPDKEANPVIELMNRHKSA